MSESWSVASQSWDELTNKPAVLADNIIDWSEINNRPDVQVLADNINYILNNYSLATHSHSSLYSPLSHNHNSTYSSLSHTHSQYSSTTHNHALSALTDTTFTSLTSGQLMRFDGTKWINFSPDYAEGNHNHNSTYSLLSHGHDSTYSSLSHTHSQYSLTSHNHAWNDLTSGIPETALRWPTWDELSSKPSTFTPGSHVHSSSDLQGGIYNGSTFIFITNINGEGIDSPYRSQSSLEIRSNNFQDDAFFTFHIPGQYALYFGLDASTNDLAVGGWSMGSNNYRIWHDGNSTKSSSNIPNTIVIRNAEADISCRLLRQEWTGGSTTFNNILVQNATGVGTDNYARLATLEQFRSRVTDNYYASASHTHSINDLRGMWASSKSSTGSWQDIFEINFLSSTGYAVYEIELSMFRDSLALDLRSSHRRYLVKINPANFQLADICLVSSYDRGFTISLQRYQMSSTRFLFQASTEQFRQFGYFIKRVAASNLASDFLL
ncbi:MAG: hypothetical protein KA714_10685 [Limnoraphis sp. WC205]|jgi:hypothetical protein|nr:hypothetical protein [Limnoraphis sp. WC205]